MSRYNKAYFILSTIFENVISFISVATMLQSISLWNVNMKLNYFSRLLTVLPFFVGSTLTSAILSANDYTVAIDGASIPSSSKLVSLYFESSLLPGPRMQLLGLETAGVVASDKHATLMNLVNSDNTALLAYIRNEGPISGDAFLKVSSTSQSQFKHVITKGKVFHNNQHIVFGSVTTSPNEYGLINGMAMVWFCPQSGGSCQAKVIPHISDYQENAGENVFQHEQVIGMSPDGSYAIITYNRQSLSANDDQKVGDNTFEDTSEAELLSSLSVSPTHTSTSTHTATQSQSYTPGPHPTPGPPTPSLNCTGPECIIVAKSSLTSQGAFTRPEAVWGLGDIDEGIAAIYLNAEATSMAAMKTAGYDRFYIVTKLDTNTPVPYSISNANYDFELKGIDSNNTVAMVYTHGSSDSTTGQVDSALFPDGYSIMSSYLSYITHKPELYGYTRLQQIWAQNNQETNYQLPDGLKRGVRIGSVTPTAGQNQVTGIQHKGPICLYEYKLGPKDMNGSATPPAKPGDCKIKLVDHDYKGAIRRIAYVSGSASAIVSSYLEDGNGILGGSTSQRTFVKLKNSDAYNHYPAVDTVGISSLQGDDQSFTIGYASDIGGSYDDDQPSSPTIALATYTRSTSEPWYFTKWAITGYATAAGTFVFTNLVEVTPLVIKVISQARQIKKLKSLETETSLN